MWWRDRLEGPGTQSTDAHLDCGFVVNTIVFVVSIIGGEGAGLPFWTPLPPPLNPPSTD